MYGYSYDKLFFQGKYVSRSQAFLEANAENPDAKIIYIGKWQEYIPDEELFNVLDDIKKEINFGMWRFNEYDATMEQEEELRAMLQRTFVRWARKNGFRPKYIVGSTIVEYRVEG